jgi:hypothetical protein
LKGHDHPAEKGVERKYEQQKQRRKQTEDKKRFLFSHERSSPPRYEHVMGSKLPITRFATSGPCRLQIPAY